MTFHKPAWKYWLRSELCVCVTLMNNTSIILWFFGISVILVRLCCPSLHWNALKPHSHVGSRVLIRRNGHEKFHSHTLWNRESQNADPMDRASAETFIRQAGLHQWTWRRPLGVSNNQMYILNFIYIGNYLIHSRLPLFSITPRFVPCRTPWEEWGQETRDGGISSGRTVCPPPPRESTLKTAEELPRRARTKTHSVFPCRCCAKMRFLLKNVSHRQPWWKKILRNICF